MAEQKFFSPEETWLWLRERLAELELSSLDELSLLAGINKGTLSKYFHQIQRPTVLALAPLCQALKVSPQTLLVALGVFPKEKASK
jgi:transcriptional regulator with XRE-family HTH domain